MSLLDLSLREKIGALICPRVFGDKQAWDCFDFPQAQSYLQTYPPRSFILFGGHKHSIKQRLAWVEEQLSHSVVWAADFEHGVGQQILGGKKYPPMLALGATQDADLAYAAGKAIAQEALSLGIAWLLAPVLDLASNDKNPVMGSRVLGSDSELVAQLGTAFIQGILSASALATAKHFPGHGSTAIDSHEHLPVLNKSKNDLLATDLRPFLAAIQAQVSSIMIGHLAVPCLDDTHMPASLSARIVQKFLRQELGFQGVTISDALMMGALDSFIGEDVGYLAKQAGIDLLLMPKNPWQTAQRIETAVHQGELFEAQLDESLARLEKMWAISRLPSSTSQDKEIDKTIAQRSITLLDPQKKFQALQAKEYFVLHFWNETKSNEDFVEMFQRIYSHAPVKTQGTQRDLLVVFADNRAWRGRAGLSAQTLRQIHQCIERKNRPILLAFCSAFAVQPFLGQLPMLLCYAACEATMQAACQTLHCKSKP